MAELREAAQRDDGLGSEQALLHRREQIRAAGDGDDAGAREQREGLVEVGGGVEGERRKGQHQVVVRRERSELLREAGGRG